MTNDESTRPHVVLLTHGLRLVAAFPSEDAAAAWLGRQMLLAQPPLSGPWSTELVELHDAVPVEPAVPDRNRLLDRGRLPEFFVHEMRRELATTLGVDTTGRPGGLVPWSELLGMVAELKAGDR